MQLVKRATVSYLVSNGMQCPLNLLIVRYVLSIV